MKSIVFDSCDMWYGDFKDITKLDELIAKCTQETKMATSDGGVKFSCTHDIHDIPFAKLNGRKVKGNQRVLNVEATVEGEVLVIDKSLMEMSLLKKEDNSSTKYEVYRPIIGMISEDKYKDLVVIGTGSDGNDAVIILHNTYNTEFSFETADGDEGKAPVNFVACYDKTDLNKVPVEVMVLKETVPAPTSLNETTTK